MFKDIEKIRKDLEPKLNRKLKGKTIGDDFDDVENVSEVRVEIILTVDGENAEITYNEPKELKIRRKY